MLEIFINDGAGVFTLKSYQMMPLKGGLSIALGDIDGDGDIDIISSYRIFLNNGEGEFSDSGQIFPFSGGILADVDGDGDLDLIYGTRIYFNNGQGILTDSGQVLEARSCLTAIGDVNNDGFLDLFGVAENEIASLFLNDGKGEFSKWPVTYGKGYQKWVGALGDIDNDFDLDFINRYIWRGAKASSNPNTPPQYPTNLHSEVKGSQVTLSWSSPFYTYETPQPLLTYNLRVGTTPGGNEVLSSAIPAGPGNVGHALSKILRGLAPGKYYWSVQTIDTGFAKSKWAPEQSFVFEVTSVSEDSLSALPTAYGISQNYPNPFNLITVIRYQLPQGGPVSLRIYNISGQLVRTLVKEQKPAGYHSVQWDGKDSSGRQVSSGIYLYQMRSGDYTSTKKMLLLK